MKKFKILLCFFFLASFMVGKTDDAKASCIACTIHDEASCSPWGWNPNPPTKCVIGLPHNNYPRCVHGINSTDDCPTIAGPG